MCWHLAGFPGRAEDRQGLEVLERPDLAETVPLLSLCL